MSARAKRSTDLPVKVGLNLDLKSRPLPVVITVIIAVIILVLVVALIVLPVLNSRSDFPAQDTSAVAVGAPTPQTTYPIDINTADADTLALLPGIGDARALAIVEHRDVHGAFTSIEDIQDVYGIGPELFERIKDRIKV